MYNLIRTDSAIYVFNCRHYSFASAYDYVMKKDQRSLFNWTCDNWKKEIIDRFYNKQSDYGRNMLDGLEIIRVRKTKETSKWLVGGKIINDNPWA